MSMRHDSDTEEKREDIKEKITNTALDHHLVSRYTSLVAVDLTPVNTDGLLYRKRLKNKLPYGWKNSATANGIMLAQTATSSRLNMIVALIMFIAAITLWRYHRQH